MREGDSRSGGGKGENEVEGGDYEQVEWDGKVEMKEGGVEG